MKKKIAKKAPKTKAKPANRIAMVVVKMSKADHKIVIDKAEEFAAGNVSAWIRHSSKNYTPQQGERVRRKIA